MCCMNQADEMKPTPPDGARLLNVGELIQDGDLHWQPALKHWVAVTPQGEEKVEQYGFTVAKTAVKNQKSRLRRLPREWSDFIRVTAQQGMERGRQRLLPRFPRISSVRATNHCIRKR